MRPCSPCTEALSKPTQQRRQLECGGTLPGLAAGGGALGRGGALAAGLFGAGAELPPPVQRQEQPEESAEPQRRGCKGYVWTSLAAWVPHHDSVLCCGRALRWQLTWAAERWRARLCPGLRSSRPRAPPVGSRATKAPLWLPASWASRACRASGAALGPSGPGRPLLRRRAAPTRARRRPPRGGLPRATVAARASAAARRRGARAARAARAAWRWPCAASWALCPQRCSGARGHLPPESHMATPVEAVQRCAAGWTAGERRRAAGGRGSTARQGTGARGGAWAATPVRQPGIRAARTRRRRCHRQGGCVRGGPGPLCLAPVEGAGRMACAHVHGGPTVSSIATRARHRNERVRRSACSMLATFLAQLQQRDAGTRYSDTTRCRHKVPLSRRT
jgi:hypothetical protein